MTEYLNNQVIRDTWKIKMLEVPKCLCWLPKCCQNNQKPEQQSHRDKGYVADTQDTVLIY